MDKKRKNIKLIYELRKEIDKLEKDIKNIKLCNKKIKFLRLYKIILKYIQLIVPYIIATTITFSIASKIGITPFITDKVIKELEIMKEFDTDGNIRYEVQYEEFNNSKNLISYYRKWEKINDILYQRNIEIYSLENIDEEKICKLIKNQDIKNIEDILGEPLYVKKEINSNLTKLELESDEKIEATIYDIDTNNVILVDEKVGDNIVCTIAWIVLTLWLFTGIYKFRKEFLKFNIEEEIYNIKNNYPNVEKSDLEKKLEIKKATYNRLRR